MCNVLWILEMQGVIYPPPWSYTLVYRIFPSPWISLMLLLCSARCFIVQRKEAFTRKQSNSPVLTLAWDEDSHSNSSIILFWASWKGFGYGKQGGSGIYVSGVRMDKGTDHSPREGWRQGKHRNHSWALSFFEPWMRKVSLQVAELRPILFTPSKHYALLKGLVSFPECWALAIPAGFVGSVITSVSRMLVSLNYTHSWSC